MKRGISFEIPNEHGSLLGEVLKPIDTLFSWRIGDNESYTVVDDELDEKLFLEDKIEMEGTDLTIGIMLFSLTYKHIQQVRFQYSVCRRMRDRPACRGTYSSSPRSRNLGGRFFIWEWFFCPYHFIYSNYKLDSLVKSR